MFITKEELRQENETLKAQLAAMQSALVEAQIVSAASTADSVLATDWGETRSEAAFDGNKVSLCQSPRKGTNVVVVTAGGRAKAIQVRDMAAGHLLMSQARNNIEGFLARGD